MYATRRDNRDLKSTGKDVRVLLAEDSATIRHYLTTLINETPGLTVIGEAKDGEEALRMAAHLKPDVISMDIRMPHVDGLEATRRIMAECPTPVVIVSGLVETDVELSFQALEAGALAVVEKPPDRNNPAFPERQRQLIKTLLAMAGVSVVRRGKAPTPAADVNIPARHASRAGYEVIAIGASAGGPGALRTLLAGLAPDLATPVVIVQHIPHEFVAGLARWLAKVSGLRVRVSVDGAFLEPGVVHLSPGTAHLAIARQGQSLVTRLIDTQGAYRYQPSVDVLFESVAETCPKAAIGIVLTGMGDDGAAGMLAMRRAGCRTFAQDQTSSTVFGMPGAAIECGAVETVLTLDDLPAAVLKLM